MTERWLSIPGYGGTYEVSNHGQVRNIRGRHPKVLRQAMSGNGHFVVKLYLNGFGSTRRVHRIVWETFKCSKPESIFHKDNDLANNRLDNLSIVRELAHA